MPNSKSSAGAPKKARWSTEKKAAAAKKPHRGQGPSSYSGSSVPSRLVRQQPRRRPRVARAA